MNHQGILLQLTDSVREVDLNCVRGSKERELMMGSGGGARTEAAEHGTVNWIIPCALWSDVDLVLNSQLLNLSS
jgi:hypothetical protein